MIIKDNAAIYALKILSTLFGIERSSSQLKLLKCLTNVRSIKCQIEQSSGMMIEVRFDNRKKILTSFQDDDFEDFIRDKESPKFAPVFKNARQISETARFHLNTFTREIEEMSLVLCGQTRTMPKLMLQEVSFGSQWQSV